MNWVSVLVNTTWQQGIQHLFFPLINTVCIAAFSFIFQIKTPSVTQVFFQPVGSCHRDNTRS